jgi:hypothetical protein
MGLPAMFPKAGFEEVAQPSEARITMHFRAGKSLI